MKRLLSIMLALAVMMSMCVSVTNTAFADATSTESYYVDVYHAPDVCKACNAPKNHQEYATGSTHAFRCTLSEPLKSQVANDKVDWYVNTEFRGGSYTSKGDILYLTMPTAEEIEKMGGDESLWMTATLEDGSWSQFFVRAKDGYVYNPIGDACKITLSGTTKTYTGKCIKPTVKSVVDKATGKTLVKGVDYKVTYWDNLNVLPGIGAVSISACDGSGYSGNTTVNFYIKKNVTYSATKNRKFEIGPFYSSLQKAKKSGSTKLYTKYFSFDLSTHKVTVKKGCPKGDYTLYFSGDKKLKVTVK